nr:hypothetical protein [Dolichospermum heterosporum]
MIGVFLANCGWGHQIPAWYAVSETEGEITDSTPYFVARNEAEALQKAKVQFGEDVKLVQDPRCFRHLVFFRTVAIFYFRLARRNSRFSGILPHSNPSYWF